MYTIYPKPLKASISSETLPPLSQLVLESDPSLLNACKEHGYSPEEDLKSLYQQDGTFKCRFQIRQAPLHPEGYHLTIDSDHILLLAGGGAGLFYGIQTLKQIASQSARLPLCDIEDRPALNIRGVILDIGRNKIPTMETLYSLLDKFALMRINHVELYMEGYCYAYRNYPYLFTDDTPITGEEFKTLDTYAKSLFIDLVPNQNVLGHMDQWLAKPQLNPLAECEDGFIFENLYWRPPMTLDARDPKSFAFVTDMLDDLLENFSSSLLNVNMDEPFELGKGKNQAEAEKKGTSRLYLDYVQKINDYCRKKGKRMMMWGDQVLENPDSVSALPKDIILLDWIYEGDAHFETHARLMQSTGLDYCLCPGTSSWGAITGRSDNMKKNIKDAVDCSARFGGKGIIITDWGDLGHWQYISSSYPAFALAGLYSWSGADAPEDCAAWFCNRVIYQDSSDSAYDTVYALGNYYHYEHAPLYNTTLCFAIMSSKYTFDSLKEFDEKIQRLLILSANIARTNHIPPQKPEIHLDYEGLQSYLDDIEDRISSLDLYCDDGDLIKEEMRNGIRMIRHGALLYHTFTEDRENKDLLKKDLESLYCQLDGLLKIHHGLWMSRNRTGGFSKSISHMLHLLKFYQTQLKELRSTDL